MSPETPAEPDPERLALGTSPVCLIPVVLRTLFPGPVIALL